nr:hypothetical protein Iba_chr08aCG8740 [Ipomoea batatas]
MSFLRVPIPRPQGLPSQPSPGKIHGLELARISNPTGIPTIGPVLNDFTGHPLARLGAGKVKPHVDNGKQDGDSCEPVAVLDLTIHCYTGRRYDEINEAGKKARAEEKKATCLSEEENSEIMERPTRKEGTEGRARKTFLSLIEREAGIGLAFNLNPRLQ